MQLGTALFLPRDIDADLDHWLEPFLEATGRSTRRKMAPLYVRGLLGSGGRKSIQPMAERLGLSSHDQLHHFISSPAWGEPASHQKDAKCTIVFNARSYLRKRDGGRKQAWATACGVMPVVAGRLRPPLPCRRSTGAKTPSNRQNSPGIRGGATPANARAASPLLKR
jgi:hypothetical protein